MPNEYSDFTHQDTTLSSGGFSQPNQGGPGGPGETPVGMVWDPISRTYVPAGSRATNDAWSDGAQMTRDGTGVTGGTDAGKVRDDTAWGGYGAVVTYDENGNPVADMGSNGRQADVDRYRGMGAAAANRDAYRNNYAVADFWNGRGGEMRGQQVDATDLYRNAANGIGSQAQALGRSMVDQGAYAQRAAAASTRGGSLAQASALRHQQAGEAAYRQQANTQLQALDAQERAAGRVGYMNALGDVRAGDTRSQGLNQQQSIAQAENERAQRELNQQGQMGYEGMGRAVNSAALQGGLQNAEINAGIYANKSAYDQAQKDSDLRTAGAVAGGVGAGLGAVSGVLSRGAAEEPHKDPYSEAVSASDIRTKAGVRSLASVAMARRV